MDRESSYAPTTASYESSSLSDAVSSSRLGNNDFSPSQASTATIRGDSMKKAVRTDKAPPPLPFFSQAIVCQGMVYCSGSIGMSPITKQLVETGVGDRTAQALNNLSAVLEEAGSSLKNVVKVNIFLSDMTNFAAMNRVYNTFFAEPKPCRTCVAVKELPMKTDVEIECIAHLPAQNRLDAQLQSDLPSAEKPKSPSKNPHRPAGSHVIEDNTDADFKKQYLEIQDRAWTWAQRFFKEDPSHPFVPSDLSKLATNYPELMEYINMTTSCAPTDTWEQTIHYKQAEIAFSILGKVLEVHVFGEELFGASEEQRRELQEKDEEMMDSD
ncbi:hypothetical protein Q9189_003903, partial [Teloschistes chrysophthalmus]